MCWNCVHEYFETDGVEWDDCYPFVLPPPTPEHLSLMGDIWHFYQLPGCGTGGPLHIVTDDGNVENHSLDYCRTALHREKDWWWLEHFETDEQIAWMKRLGDRILDAIYDMNSYAERHQVLMRLVNPYDKNPPTLP